MKRTLLVWAMSLILAACASSVKLDEGAPVADATGKAPVTQAEPSGASTTQVASVDLNPKSNSAEVPAGARVVYFDYDSFVIKPEFQSLIEAQARFIKANKSRKVAIEGHTDERGGREYNLALGQKRAESVRQALSLLGVAEAQVEAVSFGKEKPAVAGSDEAAMAKNRRAEINYR